MTNSGSPPGHAQREISMFMNNRETCSNNDDGHSVNNGSNMNHEEVGDAQHDDSWMDAACDNENTHANEQELDDIADAHAHWDANYDFTQLAQTCVAPSNIEDVDNKCKMIMDSERIVSQREINKISLNKMQHAAHDLIAQAAKLRAGVP